MMRVQAKLQEIAIIEKSSAGDWGKEYAAKPFIVGSNNNNLHQLHFDY